MESRNVKTTQLVMLLTCNTIGAGIFIQPQHVLAATSSMTLSLLCWIISAIIAILFSVCYAELGSTYPYEGGDSWYLKLAYGDLLSYIFSFASVFIILPLGCAIMLSIICGSFECSSFQRAVIMTALLIVITSFHVFGNKYVFRVNYFLTIAKITAILIFVLLAFLVFIKVLEKNKKIEFEETNSEEGNNFKFFDTIIKIFNGLLVNLWAYDGWNTGNFIAHTVENPSKTLRLSAFICICLVATLYLFMNFAFFSVLSYDEILGGNLVQTFLDNIKMNDHIKTILRYSITILPPLGTLMGSFMISLSIVESYLTKSDDASEETISTVENIQEIQPFIVLLQQKYKKHQIIFRITISAVYAVLVFIYTNIKPGTILEKLSFFTYLFYGLSILGILILRKKDRLRHRPFKANTIIVYFCIFFSIAIFIATIYKRIEAIKT